MITSIIQILAIALLFYALYRETKRDRLNELRKREELQDLFKTQQSFISQECGKTYTKDEFARLQTSVSNSNAMASQILGQIPSIQSTADSTHSELIALKPLIQDLIETKKQNLIKDGEANRTLRRRIQEKDAVLASTRQSLKAQEAKISELNSKLTETLNNARIGFDFLAEELSVIRDWMDDRGVPSAPLKKHLSLYFKGRVPSEAYKRVQSENALKDQLSETISHLSAGIKMEENAPVPDIPGNPGVQGVVNN
jgi:hypothetical protein